MNLKIYYLAKSFDGSRLYRRDFEKALEYEEGWFKVSNNNWYIDECIGVVELKNNEYVEIHNDRKITLQQNDILIAGEAELHNRGELFSKLCISAESGAKVSDIKLISLCYLKWGEECVSYLIGNFSFILWDKRTKILFGAVDHLGVRSLYYRLKNGRLLCFCNRLKEIVGDPGGDLIDDEFVIAYLLNCYPEAGKTAYHNVSAVPAGCCVSVKNKIVSVSRYWYPKIVIDAQHNGETNASPEQVLSTLLYEAVRCRLFNKRDIGILLSGGLDSSAIACIANHILQNSGNELSVFSKVLPETHILSKSDEKEYIKAIALEKNFKIQFCTEVDCTTSKGLWKYYASRYSFPLNPFPFLTQPIMKLAAFSGCKSLLTGFGGDEAVSLYGYKSLATLLKRRHLVDFLHNIYFFYKVNDMSLKDIVKTCVLFPLMPDIAKDLYLKIRKRRIVPPFNNRFLLENDDDQQNVNLFTSFKSGYSSQSFMDPREAILDKCNSSYFQPFIDLTHYYWDIYRIQQIDPLLDVRLVEFMLSLHPREFLKDGWTRSVFRRSLKNVLPDFIRLRKEKTPFNIGEPFSKCIIDSEDWAFEILNNKETIAWEIIDRKHLKKQFMFMKENVERGKGEELNGMAIEIGRCLNIAGFYQWNKS